MQERTLLQSREAGPVGERVLPRLVLGYAYIAQFAFRILRHLGNVLGEAAVKVVGAVVMFQLETDHVRISGRLPEPPLGQSAAQPELTHFQPLAEHILIHVGYGILACSVVRVGTKTAQREACRLEMLCGVHVNSLDNFARRLQLVGTGLGHQVAAPNLRGVPPPHLLFGEYVKQARIVPLVHGHHQPITSPWA